MGAERRRVKRVNVGFPVKVSGTDAAGKWFEEMSRTINISAGGVQLPLRGNVRHRDTVTLRLPLPREMRPVPSTEAAYTSKGIVYRIEEDRGHAGQKTIVVRFVR